MLKVESSHRDFATDEQKRRRKAMVVMGAVAAVVTFGVCGFYVLGEGQWSLMTCAYMTIVTLSTVGYGEVIPIAGHPIREGFTIVLLLVGMGTMFYAVTTVSTFIIEGALLDTVRRRRMNKFLSRIRGHYIVCGAGRSGGVTVRELIEAGHEVVAIDQNEELLERLIARCGPRLVVIVGDATEDEVLERARADSAAGLVAALSDDRDNMYVTVSARQLNPQLRIVSKSLNDPKKIERAGADAVVWVNAIGGKRLFRELICPQEAHLLEELMDPTAMSVAEIRVEPGSSLAGLAIGSKALREKTDAIIVATRCPKTGCCERNPDRASRLKAGANVIAMGAKEELERLRRAAAPLPQRSFRTSLADMLARASMRPGR